MKARSQHLQMLSDTSDFYARSFEVAPVALLLIQAEDGVISAANLEAHHLFSYEGINLAGKTTLDLGIWVDPIDRSKFMRWQAERGCLKRERARFQTRDGRQFEGELSLETFRLSTTTCFVVSIRDVTSEIEVSKQLDQFQDQFAIAMREKRLATWHWQPLSEELHLSHQAALLLNYKSCVEGFFTGKLRGIVHSADIGIFEVAMSVQAVDLDVELRLLHGDGNYRWFRFFGSKEESTLGDTRVSLAHGTLVDIHVKKRQALELQRNNERALLAATAADMGTWETYLDHSAVWDPQTYRLYGYDPSTAKLPAVIFREALSDEEYQRAGRWLGKCLKYNLTVSIEFELRWPNGQMRWMAAKGRAMSDSDGAVVSLIGVNWDITDRRRAEDALRKHQRELSYLTTQLLEQEKQTAKKLAQVLHDQLGQTLTATRLMLDFQQQTQPTDAGRRMEDLMAQAMSQVRELLVDLRPTILEERGLGPALDNELQRARRLNTRCDLMFSVNPSNMDVRWPTDVEYAFFMIAREALANAIAHSGANLIQVFLMYQQSGLILEVVDDGKGFPEVVEDRHDGHLGMIGMKERALAIQARLTLVSQPGCGTRIKLMWVPRE